MRSHHGVVTALGVLATTLLLAAPPAVAKDIGGRLGFGVEHSISGITGATIRYWFSPDFGATASAGVDVVDIVKGQNPKTTFDGSLTALYTVVGSVHANLSVGLRLAVGYQSQEAALVDDATATGGVTRFRIELPVVLEFFLSDHFSISAGTGAGVAFRLDQPEVDVNVASASISGTFGVVYYF